MIPAPIPYTTWSMASIQRGSYSNNIRVVLRLQGNNNPIQDGAACVLDFFIRAAFNPYLEMRPRGTPAGSDYLDDYIPVVDRRVGPGIVQRVVRHYDCRVQAE